MENLREQQLDALKAVFDYNKKLIPALEEVLVELRGSQKEDTKEYLNYILKGVNWVIQVVNGTKSLINEKEDIIKKDAMNEVIVNLNQSIKEENNMETAKVIETGIIPFIQLVSNTAMEITQLEMN
ncbi:hypothetical protein C8E03_105118 [Lachnotalea glycerini]|jgi:hypothetical protein|uniref:Molecular chaperone n=1 Tax=Lachnotalea glycerini TaxID=1763509 RepID=A0A255IGN0_9FIRM|nr:hypothetical protein [Lachnotalea glycerini]PXV90210.1 hypothetical protein C8E03_105118 [Lachnotalea glycerini]RDY30607.1 hypothetical protein CG710_013670 [Lachnotalea glycerini]